MLYRGAITDGDVLVSLHEELVGEFEGALRDGRSIGAVVGADPVRFAEALLAKYAAGEWIESERRRLVDTIARAEAQDGRADACPPH
ncbi:hypothetical protein [Mariniluteicoccus flavus]